MELHRNNDLTYLDIIPIELLEEVMIYLYIDPDYSEIDNLKDVITGDKREYILNSKIFWINKLKYMGMEEYIPFLGMFDSYEKDYNKFIYINMDVNRAIYAINHYNFEMLIDEPTGINIETFIELPPANFIIIPIDNDILYTTIKKEHNKIVYNIEDVPSGILTSKQLKLLLIKLSLLDIDILYGIENVEPYPDMEPY